jgi:cytochrome c oxidase subunit 2
MKLSKNLSFSYKFVLVLSTMIIAMISPLFAAENIGVPQDYQMIFQDAATPNMVDITWFHNLFLFPVMLAIALFVTLLLIYVMFKFSAKKKSQTIKNIS